MPVRDPIVFPLCTKCQAPQYPELLGCHEALCTDQPYHGPGKPRKYPRGYTPDYRPPATHGWGGARRGERWQWERVGQAVRRELERDKRERARATEEEYYPVPYVCAVLKKHRRTIRRYLIDYRIPYVVRAYHTGMMAYLPASSLSRLITIAADLAPRSRRPNMGR